VLINYLPILVLLVISTALAAVVIFISTFLGPHRPTPRKLQPYESGMTPLGPAQRRMPIKFYLVAVLFILFDVEIIFLYPWAVGLRGLGYIGFIAIAIFVFVIVVAYMYAWKKKVLEWK